MNQPFEIRGFNLCESILRHTPEQLTRFIRRMKSLNANRLIVHADYGWSRRQELIQNECRNANVEIILMSFGPRTMLRLIPWKTEYFARNAEGVPFSSQPECETWLCVSNPEALEAFRAGAECFLKQLPSSIHFLHLRAPDGHNSCQCPACRNLLPMEQWERLLDIFLETAATLRPDLQLETDLYIKRWRIPPHSKCFPKLQTAMYDTFYRHPFFPIGSTNDTANAANLPFMDRNPDCPTPNSFHAKRLAEWAEYMPHKIYIHENFMLQSYLGNYQHNAGALLKDQQLYRRLGLRGVCYEAFEPGFKYFSEATHILMRGLEDASVAAEYVPDELETILPQTNMCLFSHDMDFPLEQYITDPIHLKRALLFRRFWCDRSPALFRDFMNFELENPDDGDPLMAAFRIAHAGLEDKFLTFDRPNELARDFLTRKKLWDFMEDLDTDDPRALALQTVENLLQCVRDV